ncbi:MAG: restriction endonuclease subunit S [Lachnospiraceae bacterium]|nr:restriction endonuclease subunit S [Lachnospiraceae bacterium]
MQESICIEKLCKRIYAGGDVPKDRFSEVKTEEFTVPIYANAERDEGLYGYTDEAREYEPSVTVAARGTIGYTAIRTEPFVPVVRLITVVPKQELVDLRYMHYALKSCKPKSSGTSIPQLTVPDIKKYSFGVPSKDEQIFIVGILDSVQNIIDKRRKEIEELDNLIKSRFVELFGNPDINEQKWEICKLEALCDVGSSKRIYQSEQSLTGIPFLRISDLVNRMDNGSLECDLFIPETRYEELKEQGLVPQSGDILLTARGTLGRCYIVKEDDEFYFQDGMITWLSHYDSRVTPLYISYLFEMPGFRKQIDALQAGSTVAYLSIAMAKKLDVMVPSIDAQNQFADFVTLVDKLKFDAQRVTKGTRMLLFVF